VNIRTSILSIAVVQFIATDLAEATGSNGVTTAVYVSRHYEVRDHDQPVKYVFNGATRVARVTGSLSANTRIQRLRLHAGWNLCGVAVSGGSFPTNSEIAAAFRWNPLTRDYAAVLPGQPLTAGSVVWIKACTNVLASLVGSYAEPRPAPVSGGGTYVSGAGLEAWPLELPAGVTVWRFDAASNRWHSTFAGDLAPVGELPPKLAPGEAIYVHTDGPIDLAVPDPALRVAYYHQDHLGSSSAVTDADGTLVEETAYYPFGAMRREERFREVEAHYQFTQKERDRESGLQDFGHRYYHPATTRWLSPDPMGEKGGGSNPYAYVNQNPLKHCDPSGAKITVEVDNKKQPRNYQITLQAVFINTSSTKFTQEQVAKFAKNLKSSIEKNFSGSEGEGRGKVTWTTKVNLRVVENWSEVKKDDHVFRIVDKLNGAGETKEGAMLMSIKVHRYTQKTPDEVDRTEPGNKHYTWENYTSAEGTSMHEFGHAAGLGHDDLRDNLMQNGDIRKYDNKDVSRQQIHEIWKAYEAKRLNQRDPDLDKLTKPK